VSDFGDYTDDDAYDTEPADAEQVARKLQAYRVEAELDDVDWDQLEPSERAVIIGVIVRLLAWLRRSGAL
jgi:hypothetical protein